MRLIDADALRKRIKAKNASNAMMRAMKAECLAEIDAAPTIEPERKKGKWIKKMRITETENYTSYDPDWYCACCGTKYDPYIARKVNFCYVCGADMKGEQE